MTTHYTVDRETWETFWDAFFIAALDAAEEYGMDAPTEGTLVGEHGLEMIIDEDAFTDDQSEDETFEDETFETDIDRGFDSPDFQLETEGMDTDYSSDTSSRDIDDQSTDTDDHYDTYGPTVAVSDMHNADIQNDYISDNYDSHDSGFDDNTDG